MHAGTVHGVHEAPLAAQPVVLLLLVMVVGDVMTDRAMERGDFRAACGFARDMEWYTVSLLARLRRLKTPRISAGAI